MRQAVAGMTANRDEMSSSEYQHSSFTTTPGNLEEVFLKSLSSVLSHLSSSKTLRPSNPRFSGCDISSLFSPTAFGGPASRSDVLRILQLSAAGKKPKLPCTYHQTIEQIRSFLLEPSLFVCLKEQPSCSTSAPHHRIHHTH